MKTVITGGAGFIGANLVRRLLSERRDLRVVDNVSRGHSENLRGLRDVEIMTADLRIFDQAEQALRDVDVVFHLAARVGSVQYLHGSKHAELTTLQDNLLIDTNVFKAAARSESRVIYASSVSVYPIDRQNRTGAKFTESESSEVNPEGGYGWAKFIGEIQLGMMERCKSASARIFNAYGEYSDYGQSAQVVPSLIKKAIVFPSEPFIVWGDGSQTRCLLYIQDCIDALLELEKHASYPPRTVNIGSEQETTIRDLASLIIKISGKSIAPKFDSSAPVGPISRVPDTSKAKQILGWVPKVSLEEGLKRTYDFMSKQIG
jgi:GDP-D-mannose 3',5'-epimerase